MLDPKKPMSKVQIIGHACVANGDVRQVGDVIEIPTGEAMYLVNCELATDDIKDLKPKPVEKK
jgi:hypothetical protein